MNIATFKCPSCDAPIKYDGTLKEMKCEYCGTTLSIEQVQQIVNEKLTANSSSNAKEDKKADANKEETASQQSENEQVDDVITYICPSCGGEIIGDKNTAATKCPYCDNVAIMDSQLSGMLRPDLVVPFVKTKEDAKAALKAFYKGKKLLPTRFLSANHIEDITGIYVPFWLYDCDTDSKITYEATNTSIWSDDDYEYTKTDFYNVIREGGLEFSKIPADASTKMDDATMDSIEPFDYSRAVDFKTAYLSGYFADKYDVSKEKILPRLSKRVYGSVIETFRSTVNGYDSVSIKHDDVKIKNGRLRYALMPVWLLNTKYNGKIYTFAMNGQTGKFVGALPVDYKKFWKRFFAVMFGIFVPALIFILFKGGIL